MTALVFHNWGRKGDLHVSRSFVRRIAEKVGGGCRYLHNEGPDILRDVPVQYAQRSQEEAKPHAYETTEPRDGAWWINTWYGAGNAKYKSEDHDDLVTFDALYRLFSDATSRFDLPLNTVGAPADFLPTINWSAYPSTTLAAERLQALPPRGGKRVLFDTVEALSGQATNFPLVPVLRNVALRRPAVTFLYTHAAPAVRASLPPNTVWTRHLHGLTNGVDLNENAFISTHCQLIIGRLTGTHTFSLLRENLVVRPVRFLTFSQMPYPSWLGPDMQERLKPTCKVTQETTTSRQEAIAAVLREVDAL